MKGRRDGFADLITSIAQRYADYENEIRVLEAKLRQEERRNAAPPELVATTTGPAAAAPIVAAPVAQRPGISRFNSFMSTRKPSPSPLNGTPSPAAVTDRQKELEEQLVKEQTARIAAENKAKEVSAEIEDLSATLFEQANEMVASERKENSVLKQRVELLERMQKENEAHVAAAAAVVTTSSPVSSPTSSTAIADAQALQKENAKLREKLQTLEAREAQRVKRLERLEAANRRIERVRAMLKPP